MSRLLPLLAFLCVAAPAAAQADPDTTAPCRYFPLEVGNRWEYTYADGQFEPIPRGYWRWIVRDDTTLNGRRYFVLEQAAFDLSGAPTSNSISYVRFDTTTARIVERQGSNETGFQYAPCPLNLPFEGGECISAGYGHTQIGVGYGQEAGIGPPTAVKRFGGLSGKIPWLAAGIGFVRYETSVGKGLYVDVRIVYARVGGVAYGSPVAVLPVVVAGEPAPPPAGLTLTASPNPAAGGARVTLTLDAAGPVEVAVFDALGRRVALLLDAPRGAGTHTLGFDGSGLPPGAYLVRATAGGSTVTTPLTLAR